MKSMELRMSELCAGIHDDTWCSATHMSHWFGTLTRSHVSREVIRSGERALASAALKQALGLFQIGVGCCCLILPLRWRSLHVRRVVASTDDGGLGR
jgi:hypothetical protein